MCENYYFCLSLSNFFVVEVDSPVQDKEARTRFPGIPVPGKVSVVVPIRCPIRLIRSESDFQLYETMQKSRNINGLIKTLDGCVVALVGL